MKNKTFVILGLVNVILILSFIGLLISFKVDKEKEVIEAQKKRELSQDEIN